MPTIVGILTFMSMIFILLIIVKMPTIVGILTFISRINFVLSWVEHEKSFITSGPGDIEFIYTTWDKWAHIQHKVQVHKYIQGRFKLVCASAQSRVSAGLKFTSDILSKQPQHCSDIWKIFRTFFNTRFYHHKRILPFAIIILKPGIVFLPFRMVSAAWYIGWPFI